MFIIKKEIIFKLKKFNILEFKKIVSKPILGMVKKAVWKDEKEIVTYDKFSNTPIPKENLEYHGSDLGEPNRRGAFVHQNRVLITDHM
jgi:hypothetical protein